MWYVSYRIGGNTRMQVLRSKEEALGCVRSMLDDPERTEFEVGPMLLPLKDNVLVDDQLRRLFEREASGGGEVASPEQEPAP